MHKLVYFKIFGKPWAAAIALELYGAKWEPELIGAEDWPALKESGRTPFGQLPMMETAEHGIVSDSAAIMNYLGRTLNAAGADEKEKIASDMLIGYSSDVFGDLNKNQPTVMVKEKVAAEVLQKMWDETIPSRLAALEKFIGGKDKFTASGTTVGELQLFVLLHTLNHLKEGVLKATPHLEAFYNSLLKNEAVAKFTTGKSKLGDLPQYFVKA